MAGKVQIEIPREKIAAFCQKWKIAEAWLRDYSLDTIPPRPHIVTRGWK